MGKKNEIRTADLPIVETLNPSDFGVIEKNGATAKTRIDKFPFAALENGVIPQRYIPYVERDTVNVANEDALPLVGDTSKRYITLDNKHSWLYTSAGWVDITDNPLALGETESTAFDGARGKEAYDFTKGVLLTSLNQVYMGNSTFYYTDPYGTEVLIYGNRVICIIKIGYDPYHSGYTAYCENNKTFNLNVYESNDAAWIEQLNSNDLSGFIKKADLNTLKTDVLTPYSELNGVLTASANGTLTLDGGVTPVVGQTVFVSTLNRCFTITATGSAGAAWVLTTLLPNSSSTNAIITTENVSSVWAYFNSTYNRISLKEDVDTALLEKEDIIDNFPVAREIPKFSGDICVGTDFPYNITQNGDGTYTANENGVLIINGNELLAGDRNLFVTKKYGSTFPKSGIWSILDAGSVGTPYILRFDYQPSFVYVSNINTFYYKWYNGLGNARDYEYVDIRVLPQLNIGDSENYTSFDSTGHQTMDGDATVWDDLNFSPLTAASGVTVPDLVTINNVRHREFTSANNQICGSGEELPHKYELGSDLYPHIHIFLKSGESAGTTGVTFTLYWELRQSIEATNGPLIFGSVTLSATSAQLTANPHKYTITGTPFAGATELGGQLSLTLARTAGDAGDVIVTTYGVHYKIDSIGSREITTK